MRSPHSKRNENNPLTTPARRQGAPPWSHGSAASGERSPMETNYALRLTLSWAFFLVYFWSGVLLQTLYFGGNALGLAFQAGGWPAVGFSLIGHAMLIVLFFSSFRWLLRRPGKASQSSYEFSMSTGLLATGTIPLIWAAAARLLSLEVLISWWLCFALMTNLPLILSMYFHGYQIRCKRKTEE